MLSRLQGARIALEYGECAGALMSRSDNQGPLVVVTVRIALAFQEERERSLKWIPFLVQEGGHGIRGLIFSPCEEIYGNFYINEALEGVSGAGSITIRDTSKQGQANFRSYQIAKVAGLAEAIKSAKNAAVPE